MGDGIWEAIRTLWGGDGANPSRGGMEVCVLLEAAAAGDAKTLFVRVWGRDEFGEEECAEPVCEVIGGGR